MLEMSSGERRVRLPDLREESRKNTVLGSYCCPQVQCSNPTSICCWFSVRNGAHDPDPDPVEPLGRRCCQACPSAEFSM